MHARRDLNRRPAQKSFIAFPKALSVALLIRSVGQGHFLPATDGWPHFKPLLVWHLHFVRLNKVH